MDRNPGAMARPLNPMPEDVLGELVARGLKDAYDAHPQYQRNDYLGWITRAKRAETRERGSPRCSTSCSRAASTWVWTTRRAAGADRVQTANQVSAAMAANTTHAT